jgi:hypothetical protein
VGVVELLIAVAIGLVIWRIGAFFIRALSRPLPPPPPPGEMRKVNLRYRCAVCGSEVRMTSATTDLPEAPRHCMDEMDLVTPVEDL